MYALSSSKRVFSFQLSRIQSMVTSREIRDFLKEALDLDGLDEMGY